MQEGKKCKYEHYIMIVWNISSHNYSDVGIQRIITHTVAVIRLSSEKSWFNAIIMHECNYRHTMNPITV